MKKYNHNYNDGDIVTDLKYNEVFVFEDKTDGYRAQTNPEELRLATEDEKKKLADSKQDSIEL